MTRNRSQRRRRKTIPMLEGKDSFTTCRGAHQQGPQLDFFIGFADLRCMLPAPVSHYAFWPERDLRTVFRAAMRAGAIALHALGRAIALASRLAPLGQASASAPPAP